MTPKQSEVPHLKLFAAFFHVEGFGKRAVWTPATGKNYAAQLSRHASKEEIERECTAACLYFGFDGYRLGWGHNPQRLAWAGRRKLVERKSGEATPMPQMDMLDSED